MGGSCRRGRRCGHQDREACITYIMNMDCGRGMYAVRIRENPVMAFGYVVMKDTSSCRHTAHYDLFRGAFFILPNFSVRSA